MMIMHHKSDFIPTDHVSVVNISDFSRDSNGPIFIDKLYCSGQEDDLFDCDYSRVHMCSHQQDVGIFCPCKRVYMWSFSALN